MLATIVQKCVTYCDKVKHQQTKLSATEQSTQQNRIS